MADFVQSAEQATAAPVPVPKTPQEQARADAYEKHFPIIETYFKKLEHLPDESTRNIWFIGKHLFRYQIANHLEAMYFFKKTGDPVIDEKMRNAFVIRDYEFKTAFHMGAISSTIAFFLPAWRGFGLSLRLTASALPFILSMYRGFRRGNDQVLYVGDTYVEHHLKRRALFQHLRDHDNFLLEFKEYLLQRGDFNKYLAFYNLKPITKI